MSLDVRRARALPGVRAVIGAADVPHVRYGGGLKDETIFAAGKVRYVGQPVAAVKCETGEQLATHFHTHLTILYKGQPVNVPASPIVTAITPRHTGTTRSRCRATPGW